jgi:hypothetical protein
MINNMSLKLKKIAKIYEPEINMRTLRHYHNEIIVRNDRNTDLYLEMINKIIHKINEHRKRLKSIYNKMEFKYNFDIYTIIYNKILHYLRNDRLETHNLNIILRNFLFYLFSFYIFMFKKPFNKYSHLNNDISIKNVKKIFQEKYRYSNLKLFNNKFDYSKNNDNFQNNIPTKKIKLNHYLSSIANNSQKILESSQEHPRNNSQKILVSSQEYPRNNSQKILVSSQEHPRNNSQKILESSQEHPRNNSQKILVSSQEHPRNNSQKILVSSQEHPRNNSQKILVSSQDYPRNNSQKILVSSQEHPRNNSQKILVSSQEHPNPRNNSQKILVSSQ